VKTAVECAIYTREHEEVAIPLARNNIKEGSLPCEIRNKINEIVNRVAAIENWTPEITIRIAAVEKDEEFCACEQTGIIGFKSKMYGADLRESPADEDKQHYFIDWLAFDYFIGDEGNKSNGYFYCGECENLIRYSSDKGEQHYEQKEDFLICTACYDKISRGEIW
jgi:hypothetical protein